MQRRFSFLTLKSWFITRWNKRPYYIHHIFCFLGRVTKRQGEMKKFVLMSRKGKSFVDQPAVSWGMRNENQCSGEGGGLDDTKLWPQWNWSACTPLGKENRTGVLEKEGRLMTAYTKWWSQWAWSACSSFPIHHFHINASCLPPKGLHSHCLQFLLGITVIAREIEDNGYAKFGVGWGGGGVNKVHYGLCDNVARNEYGVVVFWKSIVRWWGTVSANNST